MCGHDFVTRVDSQRRIRSKLRYPDKRRPVFTTQLRIDRKSRRCQSRVECENSRSTKCRGNNDEDAAGGEGRERGLSGQRDRWGAECKSRRGRWRLVVGNAHLRTDNTYVAEKADRYPAYVCFIAGAIFLPRWCTKQKIVIHSRTCVACFLLRKIAVRRSTDVF